MKEKNEVTPTVVAQINQVSIAVIENGDKQVAGKLLCKAFGIDEEAQRQKIQNDVIGDSTTLQSKLVGAHRKNRSLVIIPIKYVFGRLFTINPYKANKAPFTIGISKEKGGCYE